MKDLDPFDASILSVLAKVPESMPHLRDDLVRRLAKEEGKEIARALLTPDDAEVSEDARTTATFLRRAVGTR